MITPEESIPKKSKRYLLGQDIVWSQFNDVNFYVEDLYQENFYHKVLSKLFPDIKISRIFPLGGKDILVTRAKKMAGDRKKIFIADKDFDDILKRTETIPNLFYLEKYSIENFLLDEAGIFETIKEDYPRIKDKELKTKFSIPDFLKECSEMFTHFAGHLLLIQKYELGIDWLRTEPSRDYELISSGKYKIKDSLVTPFYSMIETHLKGKFPRLKYTTQLKKALTYFKNVSKAITHIPGKYMCEFLRFKLRKIFSCRQTTCDSFNYRLAKNSRFTELLGLQTAIIKIIS